MFEFLLQRGREKVSVRCQLIRNYCSINADVDYCKGF